MTSFSFADSGYFCNGCSSSEMQLTARGKGQYNGEIVYIMDVRNNITRAYQIQIWSEPDSNRVIKRAVSVEGDSTILSKINDFIVEMQKNNKENPVVPVTVDAAIPFMGTTMNAYHIVAYSSARNTLSEWLSSNQIDNYLTQVTANLMSVLKTPIVIVVTVNFPDGSEVVFTYSNASLGKYEYRPGTAQDSDNNSIPETRNQASGGYIFSGGNGNYNAMISHFNLLGLTVSSTGSGSIATSCSVSGGKVTCSPIPESRE
jgi:hypothetical protein